MNELPELPTSTPPIPVVTVTVEAPAGEEVGKLLQLVHQLQAEGHKILRVETHHHYV